MKVPDLVEVRCDACKGTGFRPVRQPEKAWLQYLPRAMQEMRSEGPNREDQGNDGSRGPIRRPRFNLRAVRQSSETCRFLRGQQQHSFEHVREPPPDPDVADSAPVETPF
jgi:hypothetical protein